ncbi:tetratricopeptide repeat protein [Hanstruepera flava]|uniref:tetratricopeptide repeat protein n=1 Tax=Hanstruepera flava TaxID=2930218 RepID=UPI002028BAD1|nr:tetratricopeptide repeat protein [Hanstruepera flava]
MKTTRLFFSIVFLLILMGCSKNIEYSQDIIDTTSGRYLYTPDEVIDVFYEDNTLFLKWRGNDELKPVALDETTFFIPDMYKKLRFVQHPDSKKRYLGVVSEDDETKFTYDYEKVADNFKTPSMHLEANNFEEALAGFVEIKAQDSTSVLIDEWEINSKGYELLRKKEYDHAIQVFKMNVALHPESDNVYDSLADAYLRTGDSLNAYTNYKKAISIDSGNRRAKAFVKAFEKE